MANELNVIGLMNVQFAVKGDEIFVLEVNPRASRTVPRFKIHWNSNRKGWREVYAWNNT